MIGTLLAISGILAAQPAAAPRTQGVASVEVSFSTHAGEGAAGVKRFTREGCYQAESGGSTGGAGYAHDSQAGCHLSADVAAVFAKLDAVAGDALVREGERNGTGGAPRPNPTPGGSETNVVLIRTDGSRWVAAKEATGAQIQAAVNELPSENQWYAKAPPKPVGAGAQLVQISAWVAGNRRTEGVLAADGRWWCHLNAMGTRGAEDKLPAKPVKPLTSANAVARLGRILKGIRPPAPDDKSTRIDHLEPETLAQVTWSDQKTTPLPQVPGHEVARRFGADLQALSPSCAINVSKPQ
jgi:hypothetical protein